MILQKFMCPTFTNLTWWLLWKQDTVEHAFCMDHILIKRQKQLGMVN